MDYLWCGLNVAWCYVLRRIPVPRTWVHKPILRFCDLRPRWRKLFWHMSDGENHKERLNRELIELLNELRVALPGVQVLFAFLLIVPFSQRFSSVTPLQR